MNTIIKELLENGHVDGFLAYKSSNGFYYPAFFTEDNLEELEPWRPVDARYPIVKILLELVRQYPDKRFGVLVRGCEERAIYELYKHDQLDREKVVIVGQACSQELANECECYKPYPDSIHYGNPSLAIEESKRLQELKHIDDSEKRFSWWIKHFNRCIMCFGCRDVCPVCFCKECSLEHSELIPSPMIPPDITFHLVRAVHLAGRCIDCGLCEEICPACIPLRTLYKGITNIVSKIFGYKPGSLQDRSPFSFLGEETMLPSGPR